MRSKKLLVELGTRIEKLEAALAVIAQPPPAQPLAGAMEQFATAAIESNAKNLTALGQFISTVSEIGAERAARALGRRRAAGAKRERNGRYIKPACRLCDNPLIPDPTVEEIHEHAKHRGTGKPTGTVALRNTGRSIEAHITEGEVETAADGTQQVECKECGKDGSYELPEIETGAPADPDKLN